MLEKAALQGPLKTRHARKIIDATTIGFQFTFVMAEDNKAAITQLRLERETARTQESFQIIMDAKANDTPGSDTNRTRHNTRTFRILDDLRELEAARCGRRAKSAEPNLIHPVTGSTGMAEVVSTYLELEMLTDLGSRSDTTPITFSDNLSFTTTLEAGAAVNLELRTPVAGLKLTKASLSGSALRKDIHTVNVALTREDPKLDVDKLETRRLAKSRMDRQLDKFRDVRTRPCVHA